MANTFAPFGFAESHRLGAAPTYQLGGARRYISASNANPIYFGDPVIQLATGFIAQAANAATQVSGIFAGCEYMSKSAKKVIWSPWWPGTTGDITPGTGQNAGFDILAKVIDDPLTVFRVQTNGSSAGGSNQMNNIIGMNASFCFGLSGAAPGTNPAPNQMSGISNVALDIVTAPATTAALPFRILDFIREPPGAPGTDLTSAYPWVFVTFNTQDFKTLTGI